MRSWSVHVLNHFQKRGDANMCILCNAGLRRNHFGSRRQFLKGAAAAGAIAAGLKLFAPRPASAQVSADMPADSGKFGRRYVIRGGAVMTMDGGEWPQADVVVEGKKIVAVGPNAGAGFGGEVIDATGRIVMPGFIDTHHHQFETALRSFLADGVLILDGPGGGPGPGEQAYAYYTSILLGFAPVYRPQDVYVSEVFGGLSQLDDGVTTVHDVSQIHHSPQHSDAAVQALFDTGRRAAFGYFEGAGEGVVVITPAYAYPQDATRLVRKWFSSSDQLVHMIMGGEVYLGDATTVASWTLGRQLGLQIAAHILSPFGIAPIFDRLAGGFTSPTDVFRTIPTIGGSNIPIGSDNLFIHMTGMSDAGWTAVKNTGAQVSLAVPIEMNMRHGMPPILRLQSLHLEPSLSVDVEVTLTADFFTQMRAMMNQQRALVNQMLLDLGSNNTTVPNPLDWGIPVSPPSTAGQWPNFPTDGSLPAPLTTRDVLRFATINGAKALGLDRKTGSLTVGKEADIIILDATRLNVAPLNQVPGAVVSLMDRTNVETVIVAGKIRKWKGVLLDNASGAPMDLRGLQANLAASRDYLFQQYINNPFVGNPKTGNPPITHGIPKDLFRSN
jgi:5-methylthioadenosine/S-adenosylhomocysteine deaminase